ncbi:MAG: deoxyguanosinetriphosphate triphosphohydrolase [Candidatus Omnitrophica bacterium CG12_big_fil_rev_8_21_14_0_65_43_15]|uniref:Deoxyguanosinetriphosphate triphosphohydrolase-like protein n=1 Tax=Candidatus Taenaricola geysiri TaxID=1974752 RepID=A0A2J0LI09_9BACT|nr:MAG: deoxyguanosinetriphosphate triphosphohydrolase [Candidatus Omnitrophica bacterium CG1_02_43_210]PIV12417.1 MAG: deoxyguanosinetriphosphate triphosphohydrolase [Candidatus Omnitrophica bacterium CG03_land_8_20_14_0_80_43_22]PIW66829.1 MAG: deoxyguanosinetriphosphate triphosphohydrolase [Candidatus Omnitrophica bacterium CG12_big_fil_rev_8_21_14_0_65_43_15]PIW80428.1 MAG: deoxyguanosinetriphosphate triphosphohydrolase [Candidatus Omnitrophica bacterium CG_4_8_14_3_um_filter_43_15]PIY84688
MKNKSASFAFCEKDTLGRAWREKEHPYRSCYQRDRDRIVHSTAFRRLEYKTQVFVNHEGDYYRTRLTHTLEVAQIARSIARALGINEDLTEAIALAHDLGHTPFGHSGEDTLRELMRSHGGFDHNVHGLRVVDVLEERYPEFKGLNLSWEVREGIAKHSTSYDKPSRLKEFNPGSSPTLEAQVVDVADEIAYDNHDLDDGLTSGFIKDKDLKCVELWNDIDLNITKKYPGISDYMRRFQIIRHLINLQVTDLITESEKNIKDKKIKTVLDVRRLKTRLVCFSRNMQEKRRPLREFLKERLYQHYKVARMSNKARMFINELFAVYVSRPGQLPPYFRNRIKADGKHRVICDYIAGMTDRYAQDEYKKLFQPYERV